MRSRELERIEKIKQRFDIVDRAYASTVYALTRSFKTDSKKVVDRLSEAGLPPSIKNLSDCVPSAYCLAVESLENDYFTKDQCNCSYRATRAKNCYRELSENIIGRQ